MAKGLASAAGMLDAKAVVRARLGVQKGGEFYGWTYNQGAKALHTSVPHVKKALLGRGYYAKFKYAVEPVKFISEVYMCAISKPGEQPMLPSPVSTEAPQTSPLPSNAEEEVAPSEVVAQEGAPQNGREKEAQPMAKKRKYLSTDEAQYARWLRIKKKWDVPAIAEELNCSTNAIYDILNMKGKWEVLAHIPITSHDPRYSTEGRAEVTPAPSEMGAVGHAMARAGVGPEDAQPQTNLEMDNVNWKWGRDSHDLRLTHLWRVNPTNGVVRTPCGRSIPLATIEPGRIKRYREGPHCDHCLSFFQSIITKNTKREAQPPSQGGQAPHSSHGYGASSQGPRQITLTVPQTAPPTVVQAAPAKSTTNAASWMRLAMRGPLPPLAPAVRGTGQRADKATVEVLTAWLQDALRDGPVPVQVLREAVEEAGYSHGTLKNLADRAGVVRIGQTTGMLWALPGRHNAPPEFVDMRRAGTKLEEVARVLQQLLTERGPMERNELEAEVRKRVGEMELSTSVLTAMRDAARVSFMRSAIGSTVWYLPSVPGHEERARVLVRAINKANEDLIKARIEKATIKAAEARSAKLGGSGPHATQLRFRNDLEAWVRERLAEGPQAMTPLQEEAIRELGVSYSSVYRILQELVKRGEAVRLHRGTRGFVFARADYAPKEDAVEQGVSAAESVERVSSELNARPANYDAVQSVISALVPGGDLRAWGYLRDGDIPKPEGVLKAVDDLEEALELATEAARNLRAMLNREEY